MKKKEIQCFILITTNAQMLESYRLTAVWMIEETPHTERQLRTFWLGFSAQNPDRRLVSFTFKKLFVSSSLCVMWNQCLHHLWTFEQALVLILWTSSPSQEQEQGVQGVPKDRLLLQWSIFHIYPSATRRRCVSISPLFEQTLIHSPFPLPTHPFIKRVIDLLS